MKSVPRLLGALILWAVVGGLVCGPSSVASAGALVPRSYGIELLWHVETRDGEVLESFGAETPVNPASIVKAATSLWALDRLGAEHRFRTEFGYRGKISPPALEGDLVVVGGGDPDFHQENVFTVGLELNRLGVRRVTGRLLIDDAFWIGWEGGSEKREHSPERRQMQMVSRLRDALDSTRWSTDTKRAWARYAERRGLKDDQPPSVSIAGGVGQLRSKADIRPLLRHASRPVPELLRRFNVFSNNDIERFGHALGSAQELSEFLTNRWRASPPVPQLATLSGLGQNRVSVSGLVRLMGDLDDLGDQLGVAPGDILPVLGCGPSTLTKLYPKLAKSGFADGLVAKTGTLITTDGGVSALGGYLPTERGMLRFAVVAPRSGRRIWDARRAVEKLLSHLLKHYGRIGPDPCPDDFGFSDQGAIVTTIATE